MVNGKSSQYSPVISGVPQGSVRGPLLFLVYVDGLAKHTLSDGSHMVLCADDLLLFRPIRGNEDFHQLQHDISLVENATILLLTPLNVNTWLYPGREPHLCLET